LRAHVDLRQQLHQEANGSWLRVHARVHTDLRKALDGSQVCLAALELRRVDRLTRPGAVEARRWDGHVVASSTEAVAAAGLHLWQLEET